METKQKFEQAIARQEQLVHENAYAWLDETPEQFNEKYTNRLSRVCVGIGHARDIPGINSICPGQDATWQGFRINRRRVDQLDNVYVSRS